MEGVVLLPAQYSFTTDLGIAVVVRALPLPYLKDGRPSCKPGCVDGNVMKESGHDTGH